jgi:hypothetical protein
VHAWPALSIFNFKPKEQMKTRLYYREGSSDKEYHVELAPAGGLFLVNFAFGRRGSTLNTGSKTPAPVDETKARNIFAKLVREKKAKGYTEGPGGAPYEHSADAGRVSGIFPQLLNPVEEPELQRLFEHDNWWMQEKYDGRRMLIQKKGRDVNGSNRRGLLCGLPSLVFYEAGQIDGNFVIDGEAVGEKFFAFNILARDGQPTVVKSYRERLSDLNALLGDGPKDSIVPVETFHGANDKKRQFCALRDSGAEGVVFKLPAGAVFIWTPGFGRPSAEIQVLCGWGLCGSSGESEPPQCCLVPLRWRHIGERRQRDSAAKPPGADSRRNRAGSISVRVPGKPSAISAGLPVEPGRP